jgi:ribulose-5-phosphate 4-epimerase/fuculose-1-phosphate aldolase
MHTHTRAGAGVAMLRNGLRPISQDALNVIDEVVYHEYGLPATQEECDAPGASCRKGNSVVLLNHGLLTHAPTIPGALQRLYLLERACELELISRTLGEPPVPIARGHRRRAAYMKMHAQSLTSAWTNKRAAARDRAGTDYRH